RDDVTLVGGREDARPRARQLVVEAQQFQKQDRLSEAREKAAEAQALKVSFGPDETSPEQGLQQLTALARQRVTIMVQHAMDVAYYGKNEPRVNYQQAEQTLGQARRLAAEFGQDVAPIDQKLTWVAQMRARLVGAKAGAAPGVASVASSG